MTEIINIMIENRSSKPIKTKNFPTMIGKSRFYAL